MKRCFLAFCALLILCGMSLTVAGEGDVTLEGREIDISSVTDETVSETRTSVETTGVTVSLSGGALDKLQSLDALAEKFKAADSDKLKLAIAAKAGYDIKDLADFSKEVEASKERFEAGENKPGEVEKSYLDGIQVSVSIGTSKTETETVEGTFNALKNNLLMVCV